MALLIVERPSGGVEEVPFEERLLVGRAPGNDLVLDDPRVSAYHLLLHLDGRGRVRAVDLHSRNGTWVDGNRIEASWLLDGAELRLGRTRLLYRAVDGVTSADGPAAREPDEAERTVEPEYSPPVLRSLARMAEDLHALLEVTRLPRAARSPAELWQNLESLWLRVLGGERVLFLLRDREGRLRPQGEQAWRPNGGRPLARELLDRVMEGGEAVQLAESALSGDLRLVEMEASSRAVLCAPLRTPHGALGMALVRGGPGELFSGRAVALAGVLGLAGGLAARSLDPRLPLEDPLLPVLEALADALDARIPYAAGHSRRVAEIAAAVARAWPLSPGEERAIRIGALLHDVGKVGLPQEVLGRGRLGEDQLALVRAHAAYGGRVLEGLPLPGAAEIARHHHERWDGAGYPDGLAGEAIPLRARIVAVAEALEALTADRPYRPALSLGEALAELERCAGAQFDPEVVRALQRAVEAGFLPGTAQDARAAS